MFTLHSHRRSTSASELLDALRMSVAIGADGTAIATHDFREADMYCSFPFDFEQVPLVPGTNTPLSGTVDCQYDADGDWSIVGIALESDTIGGKPVQMDRSGLLYQHIASRIEIHCRQDIDNAVHDVMVERHGERLAAE